jgi:thymidine phosphorylase
VVVRKPGDPISAGEPVLELHYNAGRVDEASQLADRAIAVGAEPPPAVTLVLDHVQ